MAETIPKIAKQWRVTGFTGFDCLKLSEEPVPEVADNEVLVQSKSPPDGLSPPEKSASCVNNEITQSVAYR